MTDELTSDRAALAAQRDAAEIRLQDGATLMMLPIDEQIELRRLAIGLSKRIFLIDQQAAQEQ